MAAKRKGGKRRAPRRMVKKVTVKYGGRKFLCIIRGKRPKRGGPKLVAVCERHNAKTFRIK